MALHGVYAAINASLNKENLPFACFRMNSQILKCAKIRPSASRWRNVVTVLHITYSKMTWRTSKYRNYAYTWGDVEWDGGNCFGGRRAVFTRAAFQSKVCLFTFGQMRFRRGLASLGVLTLQLAVPPRTRFLFMSYSLTDAEGCGEFVPRS